MGFATSIFSVAQTPASNNSIKIYPDITWDRIINPGDYGWDNALLKQLRQFIIDECSYNRVYGNSKVVKYWLTMEMYRNLVIWHPVERSVLSMLYGPFVENGKIKLSTTIEQLRLNDVGGLLPVESEGYHKRYYSPPVQVFIIRQAMKVMLLLWLPKEAAYNLAVSGCTIIGTLI